MEHRIAAFLEALAAHRGCAPATIKSYRSELDRFLRFAVSRNVGNDVGGLSRALVLEYLAAPVRAGGLLSPTGRNKRLAVLRSFFGWLVDEGHLVESPTVRIPWARVPYREPDMVSAEDVRRMVDAAGTRRSPWGVRDAAIVALLFHAGLRVSELVGLDLWQVDLAVGLLRQLRRKGARVQEVPLNAVARRYLAVWTVARAEVAMAAAETALFVGPTGRRFGVRGVQLLVQRVAKRAGLDRRVWPHLLRHAHCSIAQERGAPVRAVQLVMGHASLLTTARYSHATLTMQRAAVDALADNLWLPATGASAPAPGAFSG